MRLYKLSLQFAMHETGLIGDVLEAYERLILDALNGNSTLFVRRDEVEKAWEWVDGVNDAWRRAGIAPKAYAAGSWGPAGAFALIEREGRAWHED